MKQLTLFLLTILLTTVGNSLSQTALPVTTRFTNGDIDVLRITKPNGGETYESGS